MYKLPGFGTLSGRSTNAFSTLKTIALAPIASARVNTAVRANPGALRNCRKASRRVALMRPSFELWGSSFRGTQATLPLRMNRSCGSVRYHPPAPGLNIQHNPTENFLGRYSARSAHMGLIRAALHAGSRQAPVAEISRVAITARNTLGSSGLVPYSTELI